MNISMQVLVLAAACLCLAHALPDMRLSRKQQRPTRGFKNVEMMTARGFGKRDHSSQRVELNDMDHFWDTLAATVEEENLDFLNEKESIPVDWFVNEMINNPDFARSVVRKFIDINQDGLLSSKELLRNSA